MWSITSLARPGAWLLCFLGSTLALGAFFLPFYGLPSKMSLWAIILFPLDHEVVPGAADFAVAYALLLLLLLGSVVMLCWIVLFRPRRKDILPLYRALQRLVLAWYLVLALVFLLVGFLEAFATETITNLPTDFLTVLGVGSWLIPLGLLLALIGGILLKRQGTRVKG